jgi:hypothetical protein
MYYQHAVTVRNSLPKSKSLVILHTSYVDRHMFIKKDFPIQSMDNITNSFIYCHEIILCSAQTINHLS